MYNAPPIIPNIDQYIVVWLSSYGLVYMWKPQTPAFNGSYSSGVDTCGLEWGIIIVFNIDRFVLLTYMCLVVHMYTKVYQINIYIL